jgi:hypothetical protein
VSARRPGRAISPRQGSFAFVSVKGIPVFRKAALFAGRRRNEDLGRSVRHVAVSSATGRRADDSGCPEVAEEGNVVGMRHQAHAPDASTRDRRMRSGGRVLHSVLRPVHVDPHYAPSAQVAEVGRSTRHHGWASSGNREEPALGSGRADDARLAACRRSRKGEGAVRREKEGGRGLRPCEDRRVRVWLPARRKAVAEVGRRRLVSNKLGKRAAKTAARVE